MREPVTPLVREAVFQRDKVCVLAIYDAAHQCYDVWGDAHRADDWGRLTLEHVKDKLRMGKRAPSDPAHLVVLCGYRNSIRSLTKVERSWVRSYLQGFIPKEDAA
jgi:hypothetical protein